LCGAAIVGLSLVGRVSRNCENFVSILCKAIGPRPHGEPPAWQKMSFNQDEDDVYISGQCGWFSAPPARGPCTAKQACDDETFLGANNSIQPTADCLSTGPFDWDGISVHTHTLAHRSGTAVLLSAILPLSLCWITMSHTIACPSFPL
jgi:hypothetical protein